MAMALSPSASSCCCSTTTRFPASSPSRFRNAGAFRSNSSSGFEISGVSRSNSLSRFENLGFSRCTSSSTFNVPALKTPSRRRAVVAQAIGNVKPLRSSSSQQQQEQPAAASDPLRSFPWDVALKRFVARLSDLVWTALRWLTVPTLLLSSGSELSYTIAHGKLQLVPFSMLVGVVVAGVINATAVELSPNLQKGFPWHLVVTGLLFALLKLPGPSYPFWGRIVLPHVANGGLWQTCYAVWQARKS